MNVYHIGKLIRAIRAEINLLQEYIDSGKWHTDECNCADCQALQEWDKLGFWQKLLAKIYF